MSNLMDLNAALFAQLDRLDAVDAGDREALDAEIGRAKAVGSIAGSIVANARTIMQAEQMRMQQMNATAEMVVTPKLIMDDAPTCAELEAAR